MSAFRITLPVLLGFAVQVLAAPPAAPAACEVLPAASWSSAVGSTASATPGDMNCTYQVPGKTGGGQFRILAVLASKGEAEASLKRFREHKSKGTHDPALTVFDSQGSVVFSISLFQDAATDTSAAQLEKLVAAAKQHLPK